MDKHLIKSVMDNIIQERRQVTRKEYEDIEKKMKIMVTKMAELQMTNYIISDDSDESEEKKGEEEYKSRKRNNVEFGKKQYIRFKEQVKKAKVDNPDIDLDYSDFTKSRKKLWDILDADQRKKIDPEVEINWLSSSLMKRFHKIRDSL